MQNYQNLFLWKKQKFLIWNFKFELYMANGHYIKPLFNKSAVEYKLQTCWNINININIT